MSWITTHILDITKGVPASNVAVVLYRQHDNEWHQIGAGTTNEDGRVTDLLDDTAKPADGTYKLRFDTGAYYEREKSAGFYPYVEVVFSVSGTRNHYHVPLLLSPFGYSTYRGS